VWIAAALATARNDEVIGLACGLRRRLRRLAMTNLFLLVRGGACGGFAFPVVLDVYVYRVAGFKDQALALYLRFACRHRWLPRYPWTAVAHYDEYDHHGDNQRCQKDYLLVCTQAFHSFLHVFNWLTSILQHERASVNTEARFVS
jgi:hypothetical protein